ncbi:MAG: SGNH/GDSL hydrolase family protein [Acidimicrobiia bacterium]
MPVSKGLKLGHRALRSVAGEDSKVERFLKRRYMKQARGRVATESGPGWVQKAGNGFVLIGENEAFDGPRRGVALRGGCDLPSVFTGAPLMREGIKGSLAISRERGGGVGAYATSQVVQTLGNIPRDAIEELCRRLKIRPEQFKPTFFGSSLQYPLEKRYGEFPRNVVVMSGGTDVIRTLYRNKKHGFVVDPGGWWLNQNLNEVLGDLDNVQWFRKEYEKVGRISIDDYMANVRTIVKELRARAHAEPVVYTTLVVDPQDLTHNYQLVKQANVTRRREFHIALLELSKQLDFHVVDVDRILKQAGVDEQVDFAHFTAEGMQPVGAEFARILRELDVL